MITHNYNRWYDLTPKNAIITFPVRFDGYVQNFSDKTIEIVFHGLTRYNRKGFDNFKITPSASHAFKEVTVFKFRDFPLGARINVVGVLDFHNEEAEQVYD